MNFHVTSCSLWLIRQVLVHTSMSVFINITCNSLSVSVDVFLPRYAIKPSAKYFNTDDTGVKSQTN